MFSAATKTGSQPSAAANYIEDVFSTYLFTGNGGAQTITNGIDLATYGGLVWEKNRNKVENNYLIDTVRGNNYLVSNTTAAQASAGTGLTYQTTGFTNTAGWTWNSTNNLASWTFRKQAKFFDVVTYTGNGGSTQSISHALGSTPRFFTIKKTSSTGSWKTFAWDGTNYQLVYLNLTNAGSTATGLSSYLSTTAIDVGAISTNIESGCNDSGATYVMYIWASNAGGFGTTGTDNVISCGSVTTASGTGYTSVNLGYEPQYVLIKQTNTTSSWFILDVMRGMNQTQGVVLRADLSAAEVDFGTPAPIIPTATGFDVSNDQFYGGTFIYMAIRRPMKVPTTGTSVFTPINVSSSGDFTSTAGFPVDLIVYGSKTATDKWYWFDRLRGTGNLDSGTTAAEDGPYPTNFASNTKFSQTGISGDFSSYISYGFSRRPGFFDEVCYTGTGTPLTVAHNLTVAPQLMIVKRRNATADWIVYSAPTGNAYYGILNSTAAFSNDTGYWNGVTPSATSFDVEGFSGVDASGGTYVAYLFASVAGVSKVGSYTGNGTTQAISCGFTGGARFVLIKRTDSTGGWYVYDTVRGMTLLTDPYLFLNSTAVQAATLGSVITSTGGFTVDATILAAINTNAASYIFLAIA